MQRYTVTLTLKPTHLRKDLADKQMTKHVCAVVDFIRRFGRFTLVQELTKASNIHYHALLEASGCLTAVRKRINDAAKNHPTVGFCCTKLCDNEPGWLDYMTKDSDEFYETMGSPSLIEDELGVLPNQRGAQKPRAFGGREPEECVGNFVTEALPARERQGRGKGLPFLGDRVPPLH